MKKIIPLPRHNRTHYYNKSNTNNFTNTVDTAIPSLPYDSYMPYRYEFFLNDMRATLVRIQNDYKYSMHCDQIHRMHQEKLYQLHQEHMFNIQHMRHHTYNSASGGM